jgi:hypothetical protein
MLRRYSERNGFCIAIEIQPTSAAARKTAIGRWRRTTPGALNMPPVRTAVVRAGSSSDDNPARMSVGIRTTNSWT